VSDTQSIFKKHLETFSKESLVEIGYHPTTEGSFPHYEPRSDILSYRFDNLPLRLRISMFASEASDGRRWIVFSMYQINGDRFHSGTFSLTEYFQERGVQGFPEISPKGEDFEQFTVKYFEALTLALKTYLHDQVTGVSFIAHNPFGK
jgi:hypothetical protein